MKNIATKIVTIIIIIILVIYTIDNIYINKERKKDNQEIIKTNEKIIANDMRIGIINFDNINPILSNNVNIQNVSRLIFEPLINLSSDYRLESCLATEWSKSDKNTYLIKLRENIKWQDGKKFDSSDVVFTVNMIKNLKDKSIYYSNVKNIKDINKIDEYTIKIITDKEVSYFEYNLIFPIMSSKYFNEDNFNLNNKNINPPGTGMYYISDNTKSEVVLKKNTNWWEEKELKLDIINLKLYNNLNNALEDIKTNNIDLISSSLTTINEYLKGVQCNKIEYIGRNYDYISINCEDNILKDKNVRQAISHLINKDEIISEVYNNKYIKSDFPLDFGNYLYSENSSKINYDTDKAKELLKKSGWKYENKNWSKKENNKYRVLSIEILVNKNDKNRVKVCELIKNQLKKVGIEVSINKKETKSYEKSIKEGKYELALTGNTYSFAPLLDTYFMSDNIANYNNKDIIDKIKKIENNDNEEENKILLSNIIEEYNKDVPYVSLYYNSSTLIYSNNLKGDIKPNSYNIFNNIETWYREYDKL